LPLGLDEARAASRLASTGPNRLVEERRITFLAVLREEVAEPMILLLLAVGVLYALTGELRDALAIFAIIAAVILVEVFNEYRAKAAIVSLGRLAAPSTLVIRGGQPRVIPTIDVVPGDLVPLRPGERVPADLRLVESASLRIDEASLTGESVPVEKAISPVPESASLAERSSLAFAGTIVTGGRALGLVVATGMQTELGRIAGLARATREPRTPLQSAMRELSGLLVWLALGFSLLVPLLGLLAGAPLREMVLTGLTLAFATIPEELPILVTIVLGLGSLRLSRRRVVVKRLRAAETLGVVSIIATDKTGTLTENRMSVADVWLAGERTSLDVSSAASIPGARFLLELGVLASEPLLLGGGLGERKTFSHDPTELALLVAAEAVGLDPARIVASERLSDLAFDERRRLTAVAYRRDIGVLVAVKGAPEAVLERSDKVLLGAPTLLDAAARSRILEVSGELASRGRRVLGLAYREQADGRTAVAVDEVVGLTFVGLVGLLDPPRPNAPGAIAALRSAGIRVLMLTGDHPATAREVARMVGIPADSVLVGSELDALDDSTLTLELDRTSTFARITPEHKLRIVRALQARGEVVAVTGDGVNDAPALREAAVGVAMGETGTDVAKESADIVLGDDDLSDLAAAVREGRHLYANLRKAVRYYLAAKVGLVTASLAAVLAGLPIPFSPAQIILLELFMDVGASAAFTVEPPEGDLMARPPRDPRRQFVDRSLVFGVLAGGLTLAAVVFGPYLWARGQGADLAEARSIAFAAWMIGHVSLAAQMRSETTPLRRLGLLTNRPYLLWAAGAAVCLLVVLYLPAARAALQTAPLAPGDWAVVLLVSLLGPAWWELAKERRPNPRPLLPRSGDFA
jgi:Ca2+-transporting ATPase